MFVPLVHRCFSYFWETYLVTISTYYNSCLDWYSMYAIRYKELVKKDEGINNNIIMAEIVGDKDKLNVIYHQAEVRFKQQYKKK